MDTAESASQWNNTILQLRYFYSDINLNNHNAIRGGMGGLCPSMK